MAELVGDAAGAAGEAAPVVRVGGVRLTAIAGTGGFSVTYVGDHPVEGTVAVKVLAEGWAGNDEVAERFEAECGHLARAAVALGPDVPVVPRYVAHGVDEGGGAAPGESGRNGVPYLVTELCTGGDLAARMPHLGQMEERDRVGPTAWVIARAAAGLDAIHHRLGLIHRDLTPSNLLFRRRDDGSEELVVADLGLVRELSRAAQRSRGVGTARYAAPEVLADGVCDERSDTYSLGVIARHLLAGSSDGDATPSAGGRRRSHDPDVGATGRPVRDRGPDVPYELAAAIEAMTSPERGRRPTPERIIELFDRYATEPPAGPPFRPGPLPAAPSAAAVDPPWEQRPNHRLLTTLGLLVTGLVAGAAAVLGAAEVWAWPGTVGPESRTFQSVSGGFEVELDPEWQVIDGDPPSPGLFAAQIPGTDEVLLVSSGLATSASRFLEIASAGRPTGTIVSQRHLDGSRAVLHLREEGGDSFFVGQTRACGTLVTLVAAPFPLEGEALEKVEALTAGVRTAGELAVTGAADPPADHHLVEANGVGLAVPEGYEIDPSGDHCLFSVDELGHSWDVTLQPGADVDLAAEQFEGFLGADGTRPVVRAQTADGVTRLVGHDDTLTNVLYFVDAGAGVFMVRWLDSVPNPVEETDLDLEAMDQVAATLTYAEPGTDGEETP